ncbi:SMP-30/gluconolactonase/LRE family protein [Aquincola sp. J276]|uniref:SMP-30/gluconolactonase/LRE family protein n=1 Tax=Aquincola sp. J276 TaxID=2898432 RepID=UPI0021514430|nr:SMP-30/gluconolactonase/LRE family protein [Aquincola sp. J276]MCR5867719.1 SMP-30/gluconolactonase/LRE family protein [Aquincola sp. J276]
MPFDIAGDAVRCVWPAAAALGEGTTWSEQRQAVWWVDILGGQLMLYSPGSGSRRSWAIGGHVSAVAEYAEGPSLLLTLRHGFARFDPELPGAQPQLLHAPAGEPAGNRFNDGKCDAAGRFWGGTMDFDCEAASGALYRYGADGHCSRVDAGYVVVNGPTWSQDQRRMYVADTPLNRIHVFDVDMASGQPSRKRPWLSLPAGDGLPDGMTTDAQGRLWIAHWGGGCVSCHDADSGAELGRIRLPAQHITNCSFGGPGLQTLFISSARTGLDEAQLQVQPLAGALFAVDLAGLASGLLPHRFGGPHDHA